MRKLVAVLTAAGVMAGAGLVTTTAAEAHHWRDRGCCTYAKKVQYYKPVTHLVKKVEYVRVRSYRTVAVKKLYRDRCGCRKFYRTVAYRQPVEKLVPRVTYERVRAYKAYTVTRHFRRRCCC
jgi:hypothetical protein